MRAFVAFVFLCACGDNIIPEPGIEGPISVCGNGIVERGEECDDDDTLKDNICDASCQLVCGNGVVDRDVGELCDTEIGSGPGACPRSVGECNDMNACTSDVLNSSGCTAECFHSAITVPQNDDDCCPAGGNANNDNDCMAMCGNMIVEPGEMCDTGIASGPGACPSACNDGLVCTTDVLSNPGTCQAACTFPPITLPANGDGCCPAGANGSNDDDCDAVCGNAIVEPSETCDIAILMGAGACPTVATCNDNNSCTTNGVGNAGTCQAVCTFTPITMPVNNDGCCPAGANANNDNDCVPVCRNGVVEAGEQCDDGNLNDDDACTNACRFPLRAYRFTDLDLRDPHVFYSILGCNDLTDVSLFFSVNNAIQTAITSDGSDMDTFLDLSPTMVFRSYAQGAPTMPMELHFANCTAPVNTTSCTPGTATPIAATATRMASGQCLTFFPGTVRPYTPAISSTNAECFLTNQVTVTLELGGIPITLRDAQLAAQFVGNPAGSFANGLLRGFISEADANATVIPPSFPVVGGHPLSELLPGGLNNCRPATFSDKDMHNGMTGWWFYLNFPATRVPWSG